MRSDVVQFSYFFAGIFFETKSNKFRASDDFTAKIGCGKVVKCTPITQKKKTEAKIELITVLSKSPCFFVHIMQYCDEKNRS